MALDLNRIKQRQAETTRSGKGGFFKPAEGKNIIRIFKFQHDVNKSDVANKFFPKDKLGETVEELDRPVVRHFNVSATGEPMISNTRLMEEYNAMKRKDKNKAKDIQPQTAYFLNVMDINKEKDGVVLYGAPPSVYNKILGLIADPDYGEDILGCSGRDIVIMYDSTKQGTEKYQVLPRKEGLSEELPESTLKKVQDLYSEEAYSQMGLLEVSDTPVEGDDEEKEEKHEKVAEDEDLGTPAVKKSAKPGAGRAVDPDLEEEVEEVFGNKKKKPVEEDEEVVLEPPRKKK